jgi:hypothetical protein
MMISKRMMGQRRRRPRREARMSIILRVIEDFELIGHVLFRSSRGG